MQITQVRVIPVELNLRVPFRTAHHAGMDRVSLFFVRVDTREGQTAWGCAAFDPAITGETPEQVSQACRACAERARDLNPLNTEHALYEIASLAVGTPSVQCAFDMAFYDLLGLAAQLPLHRLLGGYRDRIMTSVTVNIGSVGDTVKMARERARQGFRILKIKGGLDAQADVQRVNAVATALPNFTLRLDGEQRYTLQEALDVCRALAGKIEILERPLPPEDVPSLRELTRFSPVPIVVAVEPAAALRIAADRAAHGLSVRLATCGGLQCGRQIDAIARSARLATMVGCINEPALLTAAGLGFALSSPNVRYVDLDGYIDLADDPTRPRFILADGWLIASEVPGLGCTVDL
jgi:L-alanine-DL-glutamate epimerase-like enolase superfamily enzyme